MGAGALPSPPCPPPTASALGDVWPRGGRGRTIDFGLAYTGQRSLPHKATAAPGSWEKGLGRGSPHQACREPGALLHPVLGWGRGHTLLLLQGSGQATPLGEAKPRSGGQALPRGSEPPARLGVDRSRCWMLLSKGERWGLLLLPAACPHLASPRCHSFILWAQAGPEGTVQHGGW